MIEDPLASKQRWYCKVCSARYQTRNGVVCELVYNKGKATEIAMYAYAEFPAQGIMDAKLMKIEQSFSRCQSPQELYDSLPSLKPCGKNERLVESMDFPGHHKFVGISLENLPKLDWFQLFNLVENKSAL